MVLHIRMKSMREWALVLITERERKKNTLTERVRDNNRRESISQERNDRLRDRSSGSQLAEIERTSWLTEIEWALEM